MSNKSIELLETLKENTKELEYKDGKLRKVKTRGEMLIKKIFGESSEYISSLNKIRFIPLNTWYGMDKSYYKEQFYKGKNEIINLICVMQEDLSLSGTFENHEKVTEVINIKSKEIFIVHGHNEEMKQATARMVEKINYAPIILHEQPNKGRTIIEKFTDHSDAAFAIILLSADDIAFKKGKKVEDGRFRARQNVILELGFFLGKIGREKTIVLFEETDNFEIPSDYQGVIFIPYDKNGNWKFNIIKEMIAVGFDVDSNKLLH